jgi:hypothetical protein
MNAVANTNVQIDQKAHYRAQEGVQLRERVNSISRSIHCRRVKAQSLSDPGRALGSCQPRWIAKRRRQKQIAAPTIAVAEEGMPN